MMNAAPPRKGLAVASLVLGILSLLTFGCLGIGALAAIALGAVALIKTSKEPQEYGGKGLAIGGIVTGGIGLVMLPFIGIIAAIAIPTLLRARVSANESAAIGDTRTVISAQAAYAGANGGHYDSLECLVGPDRCMAGYQGPVFLPREMLAPEKGGYRRTLHLGQPASLDQRTEQMSQTSAQSYAYVAVPTAPNQTGVRA